MDLTFLRPLYEETPGSGYVSAYLDTTPSSENAAAELELRWRAARERLAAEGADEATLDAAGEAFSSRDPRARGQAVFAAGGQVRLSVPLPEPPPREICRYAPLPHVLPLLEQLPASEPHIRVAAARDGAEILAVPGPGSPAAGRVTAGDRHWPVHKVSRGGWSEKRRQRASEEAWLVNAKETAAAAADAADRVGAGFAVIGGDVRQRTMLLDVLPDALRETAVTVDQEVPAGNAAFDEAAEAESARRAEAESRARLDEFRVRMATRDLNARRAAEGMAGTIAALHDGLVQDVLADPGVFADDGASAGGEASTGEDGTSVRDSDSAVLVREAARTGAGLFFAPAGSTPLADGVAALLRAPAGAV